MTYKYFIGTTYEELNRKFKQLALALHPDRGGSHDEFVAMKEEFDYIKKKAAWITFPIANKITKTKAYTTYEEAGSWYDIKDIFREAKKQAESQQRTGESWRRAEEQQYTTWAHAEEARRANYRNSWEYRKVNDPIYEILDGILEERISRNYKPMWAFHEACKLDNLQAIHFEYLGHKLGFKPGWKYHAWQQYLNKEQSRSDIPW